jgi:hypothetical protein
LDFASGTKGWLPMSMKKFPQNWLYSPHISYRKIFDCQVHADFSSPSGVQGTLEFVDK